MRVHELAKEIGVSSKELISELGKLGIKVKNHMSSLEADQVSKLKASRSSKKEVPFAKVPKAKSSQTIEKKKIENLHEWCADGIEPDCNIMLDVYSTELPWWMNKLAYKQTINLNDVKNLPMEAEVEKSIFEAQNVSSIMAAPLFNIRESLFGFIAMDSLNGKMNWGPYDEKLLNLMANNFMEYLQKRKTEIEMRRATRILNCTWKKKKK